MSRLVSVYQLTTPEHLERLCRLYVAFHEFHARALPGRLNSLGRPDQYDCTELIENLRQLIGREDATVIVAEVASELVGLAEVYLRQDEGNPVRVSYCYGYLQSLMVLERFRQYGFGRRLVQAAEAWAKAKGAAEMRLETWEFEEGPQQFYEKVGYRALRQTFVKPL